jgi:hypothetical protein
MPVMTACPVRAHRGGSGAGFLDPLDRQPASEFFRPADPLPLGTSSKATGGYSILFSSISSVLSSTNEQTGAPDTGRSSRDRRVRRRFPPHSPMAIGEDGGRTEENGE